MDDIHTTVMQMEREKALRRKAAEEAQLELPKLLSGESSFLGLKRAVDELLTKIPSDHDVIVKAFGLTVTNVIYVQPHALLFRGTDESGNLSFVICHFSQLVAKVVYRPKRGENRVVTGFAEQA